MFCRPLSTKASISFSRASIPRSSVAKSSSPISSIPRSPFSSSTKSAGECRPAAITDTRLLISPLRRSRSSLSAESCERASFICVVKFGPELSDGIAHRVFLQDLALQALNHFPFEVVLTDVQGVGANPARMLKRTTVPCSSRLPPAGNDNHFRPANPALREARKQIGR
jgi:hypothetical protein